MATTDTATTAATDATSPETTAASTQDTNPVQITIGAFDDSTVPASVPVTFVYAGVTFERSVNACTDAKGAYDEAATADRVADVSRAVKYRIDSGLLTNKAAEEPAPASGTGTA